MSEHSPASIFSKAIRHLMTSERWERPWRCVQLDARNANTHYLEDVVAQLDRSLELDLSDFDGDGGTVQVATNIQAKEVTISNIDLSPQEDDYVRSRRALGRLDRVVDGIQGRLKTERIALLFLNSHTYDRKTLSQFRKMLWDDRLDAMPSAGLLLIDISNPSPGCGPDWPPDSDLVLDLPERFDDASRLDAHADLAKLALDEQLVANAGEANVFAEVLLDSSDTIRDVYANLANTQARIKESA
ncbi:MAG TPA: hypothetical protein VFR04_00755 [Solirubrobacterales bacterium]|nr:hypothetical protein [Solirubrobacterales bacterium]